MFALCDDVCFALKRGRSPHANANRPIGPGLGNEPGSLSFKSVVAIFVIQSRIKSNSRCPVGSAGISHHRMSNRRSNHLSLVLTVRRNSGSRKKTGMHRLASGSSIHGYISGR